MAPIFFSHVILGTNHPTFRNPSGNFPLFPDPRTNMPSRKRECTYSRDSAGRCRSAERHYAYTMKKPRDCTYARNSKGKCISKKAFQAKMKASSKKQAARHIGYAFLKHMKSKSGSRR